MGGARVAAAGTSRGVRVTGEPQAANQAAGGGTAGAPAGPSAGVTSSQLAPLELESTLWRVSTPAAAPPAGGAGCGEGGDTAGDAALPLAGRLTSTVLADRSTAAGAAALRPGLAAACPCLVAAACCAALAARGEWWR